MIITRLPKSLPREFVFNPDAQGDLHAFEL
jgi:hypothetical protein